MSEQPPKKEDVYELLEKLSKRIDGIESGLNFMGRTHGVDWAMELNEIHSYVKYQKLEREAEHLKVQIQQEEAILGECRLTLNNDELLKHLQYLKTLKEKLWKVEHA